MNNIVGYEIPIHRALTEQILMGGVPRPIAILNGTVGAIFVLSLRIWFSIPVFIVTHIMFMLVTKKDPLFFECFRRHIKHKSYYST